MDKNASKEIKTSLVDTWKALLNTISALNRLLPGCILVIFMISILFVYVVNSLTSFYYIFTLATLIAVSALVYISTSNYGESALALVAGLLTVFTVADWDAGKTAIFIFVWITFSLIAFLISGIKLSATNEDTLIDAAVAIDLKNSDTTVKELRQIISTTKGSQLGPNELADVLRILAHRKLPIELMQSALHSVSTLYTISRGDYKAIALFVVDIYQTFSVPNQKTKKNYARLLDRDYETIRQTPTSPSEFIDAVTKSRRYALAQSLELEQFLKLLSEALSKGVSADEMYDHLINLST